MATLSISFVVGCSDGFSLQSPLLHRFEGTFCEVGIVTLYQLHVFHIFSPVGCLYFNFVYSFFQHEFMKLNLLNILRLQGSLSYF